MLTLYYKLDKIEVNAEALIKIFTKVGHQERVSHVKELLKDNNFLNKEERFAVEAPPQSYGFRGNNCKEQKKNVCYISLKKYNKQFPLEV